MQAWYTMIKYWTPDAFQDVDIMQFTLHSIRLDRTLLHVNAITEFWWEWTPPNGRCTAPRPGYRTVYLYNECSGDPILFDLYWFTLSTLLIYNGEGNSQISTNESSSLISFQRNISSIVFDKIWMEN